MSASPRAASACCHVFSLCLFRRRRMELAAKRVTTRPVPASKTPAIVVSGQSAKISVAITNRKGANSSNSAIAQQQQQQELLLPSALRYLLNHHLCVIALVACRV